MNSPGCPGPHAQLIADLTKVTFLGSGGLTTLLDAHHHARSHGIGMVVLSPPGHLITPLLRITELDRVLTVVTTLDRARP